MTNVFPLFSPPEKKNIPQSHDLHATAESVANLIMPQSGWSTLETTLIERDINELLTNLQDWVTRTKNSNINSYEFVSEFFISMVYIQWIDAYSQTQISELWFLERYNTVIPSTLDYLTKMLWIPEWKDVHEEIYRIYNKYRPSNESESYIHQ